MSGRSGFQQNVQNGKQAFKLRTGLASITVDMSVQNSGVETVQSALIDAAARLEHAGCTAARFEAEYLLTAVLDVNRAGLFLLGDRVLSPEESSAYGEMVTRRLAQEPLQYIVGRVEFWSRSFQVTPDVLIPRQETEFVLEQVLALARKQNITCSRVLDMGTGSGVIAVVLATELNTEVVAVDNSLAALKVALANIHTHGLQDRITCIHSDLFAELADRPPYDLIVSNPPYVAEAERDHLQPEVVGHEPRLALFAGRDGLDCYRRLIPQSIDYLRPGGRLCLEIGADQGPAIENLMEKHGYLEVSILSDYAGRPRLALGKKE